MTGRIQAKEKPEPSARSVLRLLVTTTIPAQMTTVIPYGVATTKTMEPVSAENMTGPAEALFRVARKVSFAFATLTRKAPHSAGPRGPARVFRRVLPVKTVTVT